MHRVAQWLLVGALRTLTENKNWRMVYATVTNRESVHWQNTSPGWYWIATSRTLSGRRWRLPMDCAPCAPHSPVTCKSLL
ncbi:hypothetical protein CPC08DRAFT_475295 [Agrocybe pediades]|nr:hypothetical protein CPC08DRAFT_475295 [Agrocybe pediades]